MGHIPQELLEEIFIPIDHLQPSFFGVLSQRVESFLVFLVRMNVGIEKKSDNSPPFFSDSFKGIDRTVGTANMEQDLHSIGGQGFLFRVFPSGDPQLLLHLQNPIRGLDDGIRI